MRAALASELEHEVEESGRGRTHGALLAAARTLLLATRGCEAEERSAAHDLLAADALVTYAFEIAAEDPDSLEELAESAMRGLGALAPEESS